MPAKSAQGQSGTAVRCSGPTDLLLFLPSFPSLILQARLLPTLHILMAVRNKLGSIGTELVDHLGAKEGGGSSLEGGALRRLKYQLGELLDDAWGSSAHQGANMSCTESPRLFE